ncbi:hypothetical protein [Citrobacter freundii]|uniref:hypothetical protein n=1 Tax=Citrobacter freundii TaxID=546 RepID=UPI001F3C345C|nr:hypothetical protein [Citrobacter freundii]
MKNLTEQVSPIELQKGDRVEAYGALMEVMHIVESGCDVPGGVRVAACVSRVIGDTTGTISAWMAGNARTNVGTGGNLGRRASGWAVLEHSGQCPCQSQPGDELTL